MNQSGSDHPGLRLEARNVKKSARHTRGSVLTGFRLDLEHIALAGNHLVQDRIDEKPDEEPGDEAGDDDDGERSLRV